MQPVTRNRVVLPAVIVGMLTLGACGVGGASHVVRPSSAGVTPTSQPTATTPGTGAAASSTAPAVSQQTLSQIDAELGALDNSLNQANADIDNPQGDS